MAYTPYHNILGSNGVVQVLVEKAEAPNNLKNITLTNVHNSADATIDLSIRNLTSGAETYYFVKSLVIPSDATYTIDIPSFSRGRNRTYSLVITVGSSDTVDVILS